MAKYKYKYISQLHCAASSCIDHPFCNIPWEASIHQCSIAHPNNGDDDDDAHPNDDNDDSANANSNKDDDEADRVQW